MKCDKLKDTNYCEQLKARVPRDFCNICKGEIYPKPREPQPPTELQKYYNACKGICEACGECLIADKLCKAGHYDRGYFCKLARWPEPPEELKRAKEELTP